MLRPIFFFHFLLLLLSCASTDNPEEHVDPPEWIRPIITEHEKGIVSYESLLTHASFDSFRTKPQYRKEFRRFLLDRVDVPYGHIMGYDTSSEIQILGKVIDEASQKGIPQVRVEFVQTGINGLYFDDDTLFNPVHYGFVLSDSNGSFTLKGSLPGYYPDEENPPPPRHTHFNIAAPNYRPYYGEFNFSDDTILQALIDAGNDPGDPVAKLKINSEDTYTLIIPLQPK